ncbi:MAG: pyrroline-5-carboxylate reductase dimerization domain-containing protein [Rikenellaceae bacterium]
MKITIIGAGNMGGAIALGIAGGTKVSAEDITVTARTEATLAKVISKNDKIKTSLSNIEAVQGADMVFLAVKPWFLADVVAEIKPYMDYSKCAVASVVAGIPFKDIAEMFDKGDGKYPLLYRVIPNTGISLGKSVTYISENGASQEQCDFLKSLFDELGITIFVTEQMLTAGTSLASCGIAFALKFLDASIKAGVNDGFTEEEAREVVLQTMSGALELLKTNNTMPQTEIDKVTTPGGLTLKGLSAMAENGFENSVMQGILQSR